MLAVAHLSYPRTTCRASWQGRIKTVRQQKSLRPSRVSAVFLAGALVWSARLSRTKRLGDTLHAAAAVTQLSWSQDLVKGNVSELRSRVCLQSGMLAFAGLGTLALC